MSAIGILLQLAYRLRRHFVVAWSVGRWLGTILVVACLALLIARRAVTWDVILVAALFVLYLAIQLWASHKGFLHFEATPAAEALLDRVPPAPPLAAEERVPVQAGGPFTVHGQEQYYVNLEADYESVQSREHIVLAWVTGSRFLLGTWPEFELGYWYAFFQPGMLRQVRAGYLHSGARPRLALEVVFCPDEETRHALYLASDPAHLRRIRDDLLSDAPPDRGPAATGGAG